MEDQTPILVELDAGACLPHRASPEAAGYDLASRESVILSPGATLAVGTGVRVALPAGLMGEVRSRSGLALKNSIAVLNSPGTIDPDYRGEIRVILHNFGREPFSIEKGMRVAQLVFARFETPRLSEGAVDRATLRGEGGFGHTGLKTEPCS